MRRKHLIAGVLFTVLASPLAADAARAANSGSGWFRMAKTKSTFKHVCAFRMPHDETPGVRVTTVFLADKPLDCAAADAGFEPVAAVRQQVDDQNGAYFHFTLDPGGESVPSGQWYSNEPSDSFSMGGQGKLELKTNSESRVEGSWKTTKPESFFDKTFEFEARFATDVLAGSFSGTPLAKDGGEAGKVLAAYLKALAKNDYPGLKKTLTRAEYESLPPAEIYKEMPTLRDMQLKEAKVSGGMQRGDLIALEVEGKSFGGDTMRGRILLEKEDGAWKISGKTLRVVFD